MKSEATVRCTGNARGVTAEGQVVAPVLLADVAQGIGGPLLIGLVDRHQVGEVEHVDLLELGRGSVLRGHHVHREIGEVDDLGVGLTYSGSLQDHQIETPPP